MPSHLICCKVYASLSVNACLRHRLLREKERVWQGVGCMVWVALNDAQSAIDESMFRQDVLL